MRLAVENYVGQNPNWSKRKPRLRSRVSSTSSSTGTRFACTTSSGSGSHYIDPGTRTFHAQREALTPCQLLHERRKSRSQGGSAGCSVMVIGLFAFGTRLFDIEHQKPGTWDGLHTYIY